MGKAQVAANSRKEKSCKKTTSPNNQMGLQRTSKRLAGSEPEFAITLVCSEKALEYKRKKTRGEANPNLQQMEGQPDTNLDNRASIGSESSCKSIKPPKIPRTTNNEDEEVNTEESGATQSFATLYSLPDGNVPIKLFGAIIGGSSNKKLPIDSEIPRRLSTASVTSGVSEVMPTEGALMLSSANENHKLENSASKQRHFAGISDESIIKSPDVAVSSEPRRFSQRLAGNKPEVMPDGRALEYASKKSCKNN